MHGRLGSAERELARRQCTTCSIQLHVYTRAVHACIRRLALMHCALPHVYAHARLQRQPTRVRTYVSQHSMLAAGT